MPVPILNPSGSLGRQREDASVSVPQGLFDVATRLRSPKSWHEMPGNVVSVSPSHRVRYDRFTELSDFLGPWINPGTTNHTVPYGTDHARVFPRHFMPGLRRAQSSRYHHFFPMGQSFPEVLPIGSARGIRSRRSRRFRRLRRCS